MSRTNRNFVAAYTVLVGLPVLALAGVLRMGHGLSAPASVSGLWKIDSVGSVASNFSCARALSNSSLQISQSGMDLSLTLNAGLLNAGLKNPANGTLEGVILKVPSISVPNSTDPSCGPAQDISLVATLDPKADPPSLTGKISFANCPACAPLEFHAVRQPATPRDGAR